MLRDFLCSFAFQPLFTMRFVERIFVLPFDFEKNCFMLFQWDLVLISILWILKHFLKTKHRLNFTFSYVPIFVLFCVFQQPILCPFSLHINWSHTKRDAIFPPTKHISFHSIYSLWYFLSFSLAPYLFYSDLFYVWVSFQSAVNSFFPTHTNNTKEFPSHFRFFLAEKRRNNKKYVHFFGLICAFDFRQLLLKGVFDFWSGFCVIFSPM